MIYIIELLFVFVIMMFQMSKDAWNDDLEPLYKYIAGFWIVYIILTPIIKVLEL